ncbi:MAG: glycosyltransferase family 9 protein [Chthonomonadales bacterium]|nr:glycosyltransferase family 9 protein [Chthonomonadales bacterium]
MSGTPRPPDMRAVRRLLIVKLSSIGDVVHALPVSAALGRSFPHLEITWVVEAMAAPMVRGNPWLSEVITLPPDWRRHRLSAAAARRFLALRADLRARRFDVALDLQGLSKSALIAWASGAPRRYGYDWLRELAPLLERRVPRQASSVHVVEQFLDVAGFLGARTRPVEFPLDIPDADARSARELLTGSDLPPGAAYLAVNPSAGGGGNKGWGADRFAAALDDLARDPGLPAVLVGGPGDREVGEAIRRSAVTRPRDLIGQTNLKQLAAILRGCAGHLCGDTGSAHIAAALGTPVVSLFGRSNPARLAPYGQERFALHHRERCADPCRRFHERAPLNSHQKCLCPPPRCLAAIGVDEVVAAVRGALGANARPRGAAGQAAREESE